ncbi:MAG: TonB-dependent receptor plug domain-containing protein, partial [Saprospiraceae bacterium]|nr:TonB-dependent receptor plug domain-containing protein [Saprospiraceae bacterium]
MLARILLLVFIPVLGPLMAQHDSTLMLSPERLSEGDIRVREAARSDIMVSVATLAEEVVSEQPFTVWVITADDILRNGYVTLGDVLRAAPGIRVSQPGNAQEGETFLMRGMAGNQYTKILLNGVAIKPSVAQGMPIGAQLPIRQAERIEIMYGPASGLYGNEACAGVINIILKESERPVFVQADLSFNLDYNSIDLMFGGRAGKDKNIFKYSLYGRSTGRGGSDVYNDLAPYRISN